MGVYFYISIAPVERRFVPSRDRIVQLIRWSILCGGFDNVGGC